MCSLKTSPNFFLRLSSSMTCARCKSRLLFTTGKGKGGDTFDYYICSSRHRGKGCNLPYLPAVDIEDRIARSWHLWVHLDRLDGQAVGRELQVLVVGDHGHSERLARAQRRIARLDTERVKLVQMAYADAIPMDLLKIEQGRITIEREQAEREAADAQDRGQDVLAVYERARALMERGTQAYELGGPDARRLLIRAFLSRIEVDLDDEEATLASPWLEIQAAATHLRESSTRRAKPLGSHESANRARRHSTTNPGLTSGVRGSTMNPLVELRGFEPLTPSMRTRCATGLRHSP
jgi:site-specific DNA recombinase